MPPLDVDEFIREREADWQRLETLLARIDRQGDRDLDTAALHELIALYRRACSDLNRARARTAHAGLLERLNLLTGRAYRQVYRDAQRTRLGAALRRFYLIEVPARFRERVGAVALAAACMLAGALTGFAAVVQRPARAQALVPGMFYAESPKERVERIEKDPERIDRLEEAGAFSAELYTHNIQVAFLAFALGALSLVGGVWILYYNGVILGAVAAQYWLDGVTRFFVAWVGPHGALELPAIVFAGAAGFVAGRALWLSGDRTAGAALRESLPAARGLLLAAATILVGAGIIEGSFSQFSSRIVSYDVKMAIAAALFVALMAYLFLPRRGR